MMEATSNQWHWDVGTSVPPEPQAVRCIFALGNELQVSGQPFAQWDHDLFLAKMKSIHYCIRNHLLTNTVLPKKDRNSSSFVFIRFHSVLLPS